MLAINKQSLPKQARSIEQLRAVVFRGKPEADERYFRTNIHGWLLADRAKRPTWGTAVREMVTAINKTSTLKYCYFNEAMGQMVVKMDFEDWAALCRNEIYHLLKNLYGGSNGERTAGAGE